MIENRTAYDVGWNDCAYGINTYPGSWESSVADYANRLLETAFGQTGDYARGCEAACRLFLTAGVEKLAYRGGWNPGRCEQLELAQEIVALSDRIERLDCGGTDYRCVTQMEQHCSGLAGRLAELVLADRPVREEGYYWIQLGKGDPWDIAYWGGTHWLYEGDTYPTMKVGSGRIVPPS